jgi:hypothetical protein
MLDSASGYLRRNVAHRSTEIGEISRMRSVVVVNVHSEQLWHGRPARTHSLMELAPRLPMRRVGFSNQPVTHRAGHIAAQ